ncbi:MAG: hypothetical protein NT069_11275 [Planctomycetota bacterium]|nr:hypothetical protein [Planctomycetota bacterium]
MGWEWLRHAFAIPKEADFQPDERQRLLVDRLCRATVDRELETPALLTLETVRPLHFVSAQALHFFTPLVAALGDAGGMSDLAKLLEHPGAIEYVVGRLEALASERGKKA